MCGAVTDVCFGPKADIHELHSRSNNWALPTTPSRYRTSNERFWSIRPASISAGRFNEQQLECGTLKLERIDPIMVRDLGEGSDDEMVLGFLRAEIDSPQYASDYAKMLDSFGFDRSALIDNGDLTDTYANHVRAIMLSMVRGYGAMFICFIDFRKT
jgi:hypothetical protein